MLSSVPAAVPPFMGPDEASDRLFGLLAEGKPCMVARFGSVELNAVVNARGVQAGPHPVAFIRGKAPQWWWNARGMEEMQANAGFFPADEQHILRFSQLMESDARELDLLASWRPEERFLPELSSVGKIPLVYLEPWWSVRPWTRILEGKRVLVIHPFSAQIEAQYAHAREHLFASPDVLPPFTLLTLPAVQSIGGEAKGYADWFEALRGMETKMDSLQYDIALLGCGAYGFPLAAHAKRTGHQAVHMGGALQLLFGIKGRRWEDPQYGVREWGLPEGYYPGLFNEYWIRPGDAARPRNADQVENACYW